MGTKGLTRRGFLAGSALAGAGMLGSGLLVGCSTQGDVQASGKDDDVFEKSIEWQAEYDVVVIGLGGAGANAAIAAADEGASVLVLEKAPENEAGGNSIACMQLLCWSESRDDMIEYISAMRGEYVTPSDDIIEMYASELVKNKEWVELLGATSPAVTSRCEWPELPGASSFRVLTVHDGKGDGAAYKLFKENVEKRSDQISVWYEAPAVDLIQEPYAKIVHGVKAEVDGQVVNVRAKNGVVIALGGFENSPEYQQSYLGHEFWPSLGRALHNTGDGIKMVQKIGADLWHMANFETNNFEFYDEDTKNCTWKWDAGIRGILVGGNGKRFINEHDTGSSTHGHLNYGGSWLSPALPDTTYQVMDQSIFDLGSLYSTWSADGSEEIEKGWILKADSLEELGELMGMTGEAIESLSATVSEYNRFCSEGVDPAFGRDKDLAPLSSAPYYAVKLTHTVVNTQGGAVRNENGEILDPDGNPIPHLYEAGEFGDIWSHLYQGACNLGGGMIYGRISGRNAAKKKDDNFDQSVMDGRENYVPVARESSTTSETAYSAAENEFIGQAEGKKGPIVVKVTLIDDTIASVEVLENDETPSIADGALSEIPASIVAANSSEVDVVAGATITSRGIMEAVQAAVDGAK